MTTAIAKKELIPQILASKRQPQKKISWEVFKNRYLVREDGYTYEWVNGEVEKTKRAMNYEQIFICQNLTQFFFQLVHLGKVKGLLSNEIDTFFAGNHRRPDMCYLTEEQIRDSKENIIPVPEFVIEIISSNDNMNRAQKKLLDYWRAEVKVVWHIFPDLKVVNVYFGRNMHVCMGDDICSATPVLPDFNISVMDIFK